MEFVIKVIVKILLVLVIFSSPLLAQPGFEEDEIPVDGGIEILIAVGAIWGIKKLREKNK